MYHRHNSISESYSVWLCSCHWYWRLPSYDYFVCWIKSWVRLNRSQGGFSCRAWSWYFYQPGAGALPHYSHDWSFTRIISKFARVHARIKHRERGHGTLQHDEVRDIFSSLFPHAKRIFFPSACLFYKSTKYQVRRAHFFLFCFPSSNLFLRQIFYFVKSFSGTPQIRQHQTTPPWTLVRR